MIDKFFAKEKKVGKKAEDFSVWILAFVLTEDFEGIREMREFRGIEIFCFLFPRFFQILVCAAGRWKGILKC